MPMIINPFAFSSSNPTLLQIITDAGLTSNLVLCLDAGDLASYDGTSQTWTDVSGGSQSFFRGSSGSAQGSDPTFNGVAGNKSENEYFSVDGGDYFTETSTSLNFAESWHKNNAAFTFGFVMYAARGDAANAFGAIFQNDLVAGAAPDTPGVSILIEKSSGALELHVNRDAGAFVLEKVLKSGLFPSSRAFVCGIFTVNEAAGSGLMKFSDAAASALTGMGYSTPASTGSTKIYALLANSDGALPWASGVRIACVFAWNSVLTTGNLDTLYAALKLRFTTLP